MKLNKFNSDHEFDIEGYNYTFVSNIPVIHALAEFNQSFVGLDLSSLNDTTGKNKDITDRVSSAYDDLLESLEIFATTPFSDFLYTNPHAHGAFFAISE